jgi:cytochrome c oxidase cbb3-type subunit 3
MHRLALLVLAVASVAACDPSRGEVRQWRPDDHDQPANAPSRQGVANKKTSAGDDTIDLVELAWQKNCASCHGQRGAGDGPQGGMVRATDLTSPEWQAKRSDAEITATIQKGKGKMPAFDLPPAVMDGLVKRIRSSRSGG